VAESECKNAYLVIVHKCIRKFIYFNVNLPFRLWLARVNFPGTDVMVFKIFSPKNLAKMLTFFAQTTASF
jgi:hypothetical protein